MPSRLRHIAVYVEDPLPGKYSWVLSEAHGGEWVEINRSHSPVTTYKVAMADGLLVLQDMVSDLDSGPRTEGAESREIGAEAEPALKEPAPAEAVRRSGRQFFGFGPVR